MKTQKHLYRKIYKTVPAFLIIFTFYIVIMPDTALAFIGDSSKTKINSQDDFDKKFREARDSIDKEEWAKAAEKFKELIAKYSNNKSTDAALYWLAFSYKKQKNYREANAVLDRLTREFSDSSWADDARVMKMEVMPSLFSGFGSNEFSKNYNFPNPSIKTGLAPTISAPNYQTALGNLISNDSKIPLEREDEIKLAAFQSLLSADTKRAIEILGDIIKPDSKASESLKRYALRTLKNSYRTNPQLTQLLREILINNLQKQPDSKVGTEIIYTLGSINDEQSIVYLAKLYASENNAETKKAIINVFGSNLQSYFYTFNTDATTLSTTNSYSSRKTQLDSLLEIVRTEKNTELRQLAFSKLSRFGNLTANPQFVGTISQMYDLETDENFKLSIIRTLREIKQSQASKKLLDIAKTEKSDKLKLEAIRSLRTSRDPEVLKFLEQLIK